MSISLFSMSVSTFSSVQFSCSVVSDSLQPHESQHARPPCPSPTPRVHSDLRPSGKQKKAGVAILISDKIDLKIKTIRDKEGHYIMIKGSIQEVDIKIVNIYVPNIGAL